MAVAFAAWKIPEVPKSPPEEVAFRYTVLKEMLRVLDVVVELTFMPLMTSAVAAEEIAAGALRSPI